MSELLVFNGIDATTGDYLLPPLQLEQMAAIIKGEKADESLVRELKYKYEQSTIDHYGIKEDIDPKDLSQSGWGVIFPSETDLAIMDALKPLLEWRSSQAGDKYREYMGEEGYNPGQSKNAWLSRHNAGPGPADPTKVPYYLLIVGDPEDIPFYFQIQLDVQYAVGRIYFETVEEYANYAHSVVESEKQKLDLPRHATFFSVSNPDDRTTNLSSNNLVKPLAEYLAQHQPEWQIQMVMENEATKARLGTLLGGEETPALLFLASHGIGFPNGHRGQFLSQGAPLCQDWPGPKNWRGSIEEGFYFSAADLASNANLWGLIAFMFTSYGVGTPQRDQFARQAFKTSQDEIAPRNFIARLPQRLLAHPKGGALAILGHFGRAWGYSFLWDKLGRGSAVYQSTIRRLMDGHPVGSAFEYVNQRFAELSSDLSVELEDISFGQEADPYKLSGIWSNNNDARNYMILGDPAVRMMVGQGTETGAGRILDLRDKVVFESSVLTEIPQDVPEFISLLRSKNEHDLLMGATEAVEIVKRSTEISERMLGEDEAQLDPEDQKITRGANLLRTEIARLVQILVKGNRKDRENTLLVLEILGPIARTEAVPVLKDLILKYPDEQFSPRLVKTIVIVDNREDDLTDELRSFLNGGILSVRLEVLEAIKSLKENKKILKPEMVKNLWDLSRDESIGKKVVETLFIIYDDKYNFLIETFKLIDRGELTNLSVRCVAGSLLLAESKSLEEAWIENRENKTLIFDLLIATLTMGTLQARQDSVDWLLKRVEDIPGEHLDEMINDLKVLSHRDEEWVEQSQLDTLIRSLVKRKRAERTILVEDLRGTDSVAQIEAIKRAANSEDEWALRILVQEWAQWIAFGQNEKTQLVEEVAEKIRYNPLAVLPLVNQINQSFQPTKEDLMRAFNAVSMAYNNPANRENTSESEITEKPKPDTSTQIAPTTDTYRLEEQIEAVLDSLNTREWNIRQKILKQMINNNKVMEMDEENQRKYILASLNEEFKAFELKVHRRVARQLADMSNPYFFEETTENEIYRAMKASMEKYAVPVLARILPEASDDDIRKDLAFTLGNISGREAVDALARAVVGEERTRANRQKLLAEYYLEPSKQRSDEAAVILQEAIKDAKRTLWLQQGLNIAVFIVGMIILVAGLIFALQSQDAATRVAGILAGIGGFGGVILQLIKNPMDRIQNAMANLVQLETAFTSFIWELNLNGTFIQSQYVAAGVLDGDDVGQTIQRIEDAMNLTLDQVAAYTDRGRQNPIAQIIRLSPIVGKPGITIQVFGSNLGRNRSQNENSAAQIAVALNHVPAISKDLDKKKDVVEFKLPLENLPDVNATNGLLWISLVIDGQETNALPFKLL